MKFAVYALILALLNGCFAGISRKEFYTTQRIPELSERLDPSEDVCDISLDELQISSKAYAFVMFLPPLIIPASWFDRNWASKADPYQIKLTNTGIDSAFIVYAYADSISKGETSQESLDSLLMDSTKTTQFVLPSKDHRILFSRHARTAYIKIANKNSCTKYVQLNPNARISFDLITD